MHHEDVSHCINDWLLEFLEEPTLVLSVELETKIFLAHILEHGFTQHNRSNVTNVATSHSNTALGIAGVNTGVKSQA